MALDLTHNMFVSRKMEADYVGTDLATVSFSTEKDNGALCVLGAAVSSAVFNQVLDMNHYNGEAPANITVDSIYVVDDPSVFEIVGLRADVVDPRAFSVPAETPARAKRLVAGDEGWWSEGCFSSTVVVGTSYVIPTANSDKWTVSTSTTPPTSRVYGKVIASEAVAVGNNFVAGYRVRILAD